MKWWKMLSSNCLKVYLSICDQDFLLCINPANKNSWRGTLQTLDEYFSGKLSWDFFGAVVGWLSGISNVVKKVVLNCRGHLLCDPSC